MRFMMMMKCNKDSEAGRLPDPRLLAEIMKHSQEMRKAGILLETGGLMPTSKGARIHVSKGKADVIDGPFAETKEQMLGFYLIDCPNLAAALEVARELACANPGVGGYEIRPVALYVPGTPSAERLAHRPADGGAPVTASAP